MSYWRNNVEKHEEIIVKEMISRKHAKEDEDPEKVYERWGKRKDMADIASEAETAYFSGLVDHAQFL